MTGSLYHRDTRWARHWSPEEGRLWACWDWGVVSRCPGLRDQRVLGRAWSVRKQCWDPGVCDKGRRAWMGSVRVRLEGGLRCPSVGRESIPSSVLISQALDGV